MLTNDARRAPGWRAWTISALVAIGWQPFVLTGCGGGGTATGETGSSGGSTAGSSGGGPGGDTVTGGSTGEVTTGDGVVTAGDTDTGEPAAPQWDRSGVRRLTTVQFGNSIRDLFGDGIAVPAELATENVGEMFAGVGASSVSTDVTGVGAYEQAARDIAASAFDDAEARVALVGCDVQDAADACVGEFLRSFGARAWRRPLADEEVARYAGLAVTEAKLLEDPWAGVQFAVAGLLQSPNFLYIIELGEPDPEVPGRLRYTAHEMASRLSYFLWNSGPDAGLIAAADSGALLTTEGITAEVDRLLADPKARRAMRQFSTEFFHLTELHTLTKDPEIFPKANTALFVAMREEVLRMIDNIVFEKKAPFNELFTTRTAFITQELADLYGMDPLDPATLDAEGFAPVEIPAHWARAGYFGTGAFLAQNARYTRTSPTLRGLFVQERFRCFSIPPPPPDVETNLPGDDDPGEGEPRTMRERLKEHREDPDCAGCHDLLDPIGLSMEHFSGLGGHRHQDHGLDIDVHGKIDGVDYDTLLGLADYLYKSDDVAACLTKHVYRYATGHHEDAAENLLLKDLGAGFAEDYDLLALMRAVSVSEGFRHFTVAE